MSEHDFEPIRGLPGKLPADERLLWQGAPDWLALASQVFHVRVVAAYFVALLAWRVAEQAASGAAPGAIVLGVMGLVLIAALGLGLLMGLAWLMARTTVYTITSKRVVMRFGVALPKAINIPFTILDAAALSTFGASGRGNLALSLRKPNKIAYLQLWPHARPNKLAWPEPTFRALPNAAQAATILKGALAAEAERVAKAPETGAARQSGLSQEPVREPQETFAAASLQTSPA